MAKKEDTKTSSNVEKEEPKKRNKLKLIIIIILVLILGAGGVLGGLLYMKKNNSTTETETDVSKEDTAEEDVDLLKKEYVSLERYVTNLKAKAKDGTQIDKYIALEISFEILDDENKEAKKDFLKNHNAMVKNILLLTIDKFDDKTLLTSEGKKELADILKTNLNDLFKKQRDKEKIKGKNVKLVENILFTSFIIQ